MMSHRYLFALVDGGGNVPPELSAVRRLVERGHAVTVLADDSAVVEVRSTGAELRRWVCAPNRIDRRPESDLSRDWECKFPWQLIDRVINTLLIGPARGYADDVLEAIAKCRPELVVCSMFCLGGMVAAQAAGIPFVVLFPNVYPVPASGMPPFGLGLQPARSRIGRWRDRVINSFTERLWDRKGLAGLNALRRQYGLAPLAHVFDQMRCAHSQLVMTSPAFDFPATLPAGVRYVGPVLDDPLWAELWSLLPPDGCDPLVLVAMSSTFQNQISSFGIMRDAQAAIGRPQSLHGTLHHESMAAGDEQRRPPNLLPFRLVPVQSDLKLHQTKAIPIKEALMQAKDLMTRNVECVSPDAKLPMIARMMKSRDIGFVPVCDNDRLIGTITDRDIVLRAIADGRGIENTTAREVMTEDLWWCYDDQTAEEIADYMASHEVRRMVILDRKKRLAGVISLGDLAKKGEQVKAGKAIGDIAEAPPANAA